MRDPARVVTPATSNRFFTANGTPASGPAAWPGANSIVDSVGLGERSLGAHRGEAVQRAVALGGTVESACDDRTGRDGSRGHGASDVERAGLSVEDGHRLTV